VEDADLKDRIRVLETKTTEWKSLGWTDIALEREQCWV
jgi:hypothetical protein